MPVEGYPREERETAMRIDTSLNSSFDQQPGRTGQAVKSIHVSFDPVTKTDMTLNGMTRYMQRQLGVGGNLNLLV